MKLYDWSIAPGPRRVRIFLAEKDVRIPIEDVGDGMRLRPEYIDKCPEGMVPMLELEDGTRLFEAATICRYLEEMHPHPNLLGNTPIERARVDMWDRRAYEEGLVRTAEVLRNTHPEFQGRGLITAGTPVLQIPALADRGRQRLARFARLVDAQLKVSEFVAGSRFTGADITVLCWIDFAKAVGIDIPAAEHPNMARWHHLVLSRPSVDA